MTTGNARILVKEQVYAHAPEEVWAALTRGEALAQWLMPNTFPAAPGVGSRFQFRIDPMPMLPNEVTECEIVEFDPPRSMAWTWRMVPRKGKREYPQMRVRWEVLAEGTGTRLRLTQTGLEGLGWFLRVSMSMGWGTMLKRWLPMVLAAFSRGPGGGLEYSRLVKPGNRGHHGTRTLPAEYFT